MIRKISFALLSMLSLMSYAQMEVSHNRPGISSEGINYYLPKTKLHIVIQAVKTSFSPGDLAPYAPSLLRVHDAPQYAYDDWSIEDLKIQPFGAADSNKFYSIKYKLKNGLPSISLSSDGTLLAINGEPETISPLTGVSVQTINNSGNTYDSFRTKSLEAAGDKQTFAEQAANEIFDLRESRSSLVKGEADYMPKDGEQLKLMLQQLDQQEKSLLRLFYGTQKQERYILSFDYTPDTINIEDAVLFRFSKEYGVVDKDDLSGEPIYISTKKMVTTQSTFLAEKKPKTLESLIYNVPGILNINIHDLNRVYYNENLPIAQIGQVESLGSELFTKKVTTKVILSPQNGGILKIETNEK